MNNCEVTAHISDFLQHNKRYFPEQHEYYCISLNNLRMFLKDVFQFLGVTFPCDITLEMLWSAMSAVRLRLIKDDNGIVYTFLSRNEYNWLKCRLVKAGCEHYGNVPFPLRLP